MSGKTHQEERIHPVLMPHWHFVDVDDGSIPAAWNAAVRLDRTEYLPPMLTIALISRETKRDEQRLDCFRPVHVQLAHSQGVVEEVSRRAEACIVRHTVGALRRWGNAVMSNQRVLIPEWGRGPYPAPLMYQSPGAFNTPSRLSLGILKCAISGASPLRDHSTNDPATRRWTNVFVSCVARHVRMSSIPVVQSRQPTFDNSFGRGGTLTLCPRAPERVAPRRRLPPRKHTRKSCFGVSRHELMHVGG